jgi:hypothetical protein
VDGCAAYVLQSGDVTQHTDPASVQSPSQQTHYVSIADRLNPTRRGFDQAFKAAWAELPKHEKQQQVKADKAKIAALKAATATADFPYAVNTDDHCETGADAYADIAPLLALLAESLGKSKAALRVYDPYYCAGAVKKHLGALGFASVYNQCEDFYQRLAVRPASRLTRLTAVPT